MYKIVIIFQCITILFFPIKAYSYSSSSYLIANSAISFFDYEEANIHYSNIDTKNLKKKDLEKKLLAFVNTDSLNKASSVAKEI